MTRRSPARLLAPLALVASLVAVLVIVSASGDDLTTRQSAPAAPGERAPTTSAVDPVGQRETGARTATGVGDDVGASTEPPAEPGPATYVVQAGDNFTRIAERTGVSVTLLLDLNPDVDPQALVLGTRIKLRP